MEEGVREKVERFKATSELFLDNDVRAFIKTIYNDFYFCDILIVGEVFLEIYNFAGKRQGQKDRLIWTDIEEIKEYKEESK